MLRTAIAGSLPKPAWLAEPEALWAPWRLAGDDLVRGQRDAALVWIKTLEDAGIDTVGEGEQFREHFVHGFLQRSTASTGTARPRWASAPTATPWRCRP